MKAVSKAMFSTAMAATLFFFIGQSAYAQQSEKGLKDIYANYFRIGTCYPYQQVSNTSLQDVILREFNSLTHENDLKPEATMVQNGSTDNDIKVQLNSNARAVMTFAQTNNIPIRGHTFVWHQQMPDWFFYANRQSGALATKEVMNTRMESYIKNMFNLIKTEYPTLKLYAYDVVNEMFRDNGTPREAGDPNTGGDQSTWVKIYGNNSFADSAFVYARKYAPEGCKLFYNDFNEYHPDGKRDSIVAFYNRLKAKTVNGKPVIDGIGMQSHLGTGWPDIGTYKSALNRFISTGAEIHITELDLTIEDGSNEAAQAEKYKAVFQALKEAREEGANITSVSVWGVIDEWSWRKEKNPLLFKTTNFTKKAAYNDVAALIPAKDHGDGKNPQFNTPEPGEGTADENGYYFYHDFEDGTTKGWARRGPETVANSGTQNNTKNGSKSIYVSGRNDNWNGAQFTLPSDFKAGKEYSFSAMARHEGQGTIAFKLSLQYDSTDGATKYPNIVEVNAPSGEWVQLASPSYKLPPGTGFALYVELDNASANFYVDDAMGGVKGAAINPDGTPGEPPTTPSSSSSAGVSSSSSEDDSPIRLLNSFSKADFRVSSLNGSLQIESRANAEVYLYDIRGNKVLNFNVPAGESIVKMSLPSGIYIVKNARTRETQKVFIK